MTKPLPPNIDNFSNAIDGIYYRDLYAFATVFFGMSNAYEIEDGLKSHDISDRYHWVRTAFSEEYYIENYSEFEFLGIGGQVSQFYQLLEKFGYSGNHYIIIELESSIDNIVLYRVLEYIKNLSKFDDNIIIKSAFFLEFGKYRYKFFENREYIPSYEYFLKNFTKKIDNIIDDMIVFFQNRLLNSKPKFKAKPDNNLQKIQITENHFSERIFINFECKYMVDANPNYNNGCYFYTIENAKIDDTSISVLYNFLIDLGFPYQRTFSEYVRFLKNLNIEQYMIVDKYVTNEKYKKNFVNYYYDLTRFFKMFIPSPVKPKQFLNHTHIVGRSGSGKSELLKTIIKQVGGELHFA